MYSIPQNVSSFTTFNCSSSERPRNIINGRSFRLNKVKQSVQPFEKKSHRVVLCGACDKHALKNRKKRVHVTPLSPLEPRQTKNINLHSSHQNLNVYPHLTSRTRTFYRGGGHFCYRIVISIDARKKFLHPILCKMTLVHTILSC